MKITEFVERTHRCTQVDMAKPNAVQNLFYATVEEVGELSTAIAVESGYKPNKTLREDAKTEAVDVVICALAVYFALGGTIEEIGEIGHTKLDKWEKNQSTL